MVQLPRLWERIPGLHHSTYADDITVWTAGGGGGDIQDRLQQAVNIIASYALERRLCSLHKSELFFYHSRTRRHLFFKNNKKGGTAKSRPSRRSKEREEVTNDLQKQRDIKDRRLCPLQADTFQRHDGSIQGMYSKGNKKYLDLYNLLLPYVLTPQELFHCGYPRLCPENPGRVVCVEGDAIYSSRKTCSRCRASFVITRSGDYYAKSACFFHTGRCSAIGFSCCGAPADHPGCNSSYYHVCPLGARDKWDTAELAFVRTRRRNGGAREVFALDCEMCFTIRGFEVARVSVVDCDGATVYDSYVRPGSRVLDYNTPFSGITADHLRNVRTTLQDVQAVLFRLLNTSTVLVGHGLENDLRVLRLVHDTVVDTSIAFPHYRGLPYRRSLRSLVAAYLNRGVPNGPLGHDSVEDAKACMELMLWKASRDQEMRNRLRGGAEGYPTQPSQLDDDIDKCSVSGGGVKSESFGALEEPEKGRMPLGSLRELRSE
ncbi:putative exonuclease GOR [Haemaphysalis longicornis]